MKLPEKIKHLRMLYGITQRELARRAGLSDTVISSIEIRRKSWKASDETIIKIAYGFGMTIEEFEKFKQGDEI